MKKYFIDSHMSYCYPYEVSKKVEDYGVLSKYIGNYYSRDEMDKIICNLIMNHPYIDGAMWLMLSANWKEGNTVGYYHILNFTNHNEKHQRKGSLEIKFEK